MFQDGETNGHDLGSLSTNQKVVLFSADDWAFPMSCLRPRPKTLNCVLEDSLHLCLAPHRNLETTHDFSFCTCHRTLFSDYSDQSLTTRSPEGKFSTGITLALHLAQPHCASITMHGQLDTIYDITLAIYHNSTLYPCLVMLAQCQ